MSHHFDYPAEVDDVSDVYIFPGASDDHGPRTVIIMNTSPQVGDPWDHTTLYELKLDLNGDYVADITWRFTFSSPDPHGNQEVKVAQLTGADATSRTAKGTIITPDHAPAGQVLSAPNGIKIYAGKRRDPFFNDIAVPLALQAALRDDTTNPNPDLPKAMYTDTFYNQSVRSVMVEVPAAITGLGTINCWGTTAIYDKAHNAYFQVQRCAGPVLASGVLLGIHAQINMTEPDTDLAGRPANPDDPASGIWGSVRDRVAAVVEARGTYNKGPQGRPTPKAYGAFAADSMLPNVLPYIPGTSPVAWTPWQGFLNGRGLTEQSSDNFTEVILNEAFSSKLTQDKHGRIDPFFPYLTEPPASA
jgi:Domain of unknown function (DUF4331)